MGKGTVFFLIVTAFFIGALLVIKLEEDKNESYLNSQNIKKIKNKVFEVTDDLKNKIISTSSEKQMKSKLEKIQLDYKKIKSKSNKEKLEFLEKKLNDLKKQIK